MEDNKFVSLQSFIDLRKEIDDGIDIILEKYEGKVGKSFMLESIIAKYRQLLREHLLFIENEDDRAFCFKEDHLEFVKSLLDVLGDYKVEVKK